MRNPTGNRRGAAIIWMALLMLVFIGLIGLECDVGYGLLVAHQLHNAADAATLAAAQKLKEPEAATLLVDRFRQEKNSDVRAGMLAALGKMVHRKNDIPAAEQQVARLASTFDIVIVSFHGGAEGQAATQLPFEEEFYLGETRGEVVRFAHRVIDMGADLVLGHGPHVPRAMELYRDRLIAYSLGNFATHFGVSVDGVAGWAPILVAQIASTGEFTGGRIHSALQRRPDGPAWDDQENAYRLIRRLTEESFGREMFTFDADGNFSPGVSRPP